MVVADPAFYSQDHRSSQVLRLVNIGSSRLSQSILCNEHFHAICSQASSLAQACSVELLCQASSRSLCELQSFTFHAHGSPALPACPVCNRHAPEEGTSEVDSAPTDCGSPGTRPAAAAAALLGVQSPADSATTGDLAEGSAAQGAAAKGCSQAVLWLDDSAWVDQVLGAGAAPTASHAAAETQETRTQTR